MEQGVKERKREIKTTHFRGFCLYTSTRSYSMAGTILSTWDMTVSQRKFLTVLSVRARTCTINAVSTNKLL